MEMSCLGSGLDRITDLPPNVLVNILSYLPLKDAVKTSALSKKWRKKWIAIPRIIIKEGTFHFSQQDKIEGIISYVLMQHEGKIEKCAIFINQVKDCYSMKSWVLRLSQKCIQKLILVTQNGRSKEVPLDLFSCQQLRKLKLRHFEFKKPPQSFRGFHNLTNLDLNKITITTAVFESLIASCPLLEQLTVKKLSCVDHLHINCPKLKYFFFDGEYKSLHFNTPSLVVFINLYRFSSGRNLNIRGLPHSIEALQMRGLLQTFLASAGLVTDSTSYSNLKNLILVDFCFKKFSEVSSLVSLIESLPNLEGLDITACNCANEADFEPLLKFWEEQTSLGGNLDQLSNVKMQSFLGEDPELRFIRYILANSPSLKEMAIKYKDKLDFESLIMPQLIYFPRASKEAEIKPIAGNSDWTDDEFSDYASENSDFSDVEFEDA